MLKSIYYLNSYIISDFKMFYLLVILFLFSIDSICEELDSPSGEDEDQPTSQQNNSKKDKYKDKDILTDKELLCLQLL